VSLVIDDQLPARLVAGGIALLWAQILVEDVGGEGHPLETGQPLQPPLFRSILLEVI